MDMGIVITCAGVVLIITALEDFVKNDNVTIPILMDCKTRVNRFNTKYINKLSMVLGANIQIMV